MTAWEYTRIDVRILFFEILEFVGIGVLSSMLSTLDLTIIYLAILVLSFTNSDSWNIRKEDDIW